jgi:hypothetical protein
MIGIYGRKPPRLAHRLSATSSNWPGLNSNVRISTRWPPSLFEPFAAEPDIRFEAGLCPRAIQGFLDIEGSYGFGC